MSGPLPFTPSPLLATLDKVAVTFTVDLAPNLSNFFGTNSVSDWTATDGVVSVSSTDPGDYGVNLLGVSTNGAGELLGFRFVVSQPADVIDVNEHRDFQLNVLNNPGDVARTSYCVRTSNGSCVAGASLSVNEVMGGPVISNDVPAPATALLIGLGIAGLAYRTGQSKIRSISGA